MNIKRKAWALQNCVVPGYINCVALGRKSGRVMATGGLDNKVNLWVVGKSGCIMVLSDHNSPIQSVSFDPEENKVSAGSASGSIKVWELDESKEVRSLPGHKSSVSTIDFYPFANIISSGGMDCNVKLWDIRKKSCINTYKGHTGCVTCLRFSPDGKWLVSGSGDNTIKLWDLTAGKQLAEFQDHRAAITAIEFHPQLLVLSSSSKDHTIKLFDLQDFKFIESTLRTDCASSIDKLCFHPRESVLYAASTDYLKIYNPEPLSHLESIHVGWQNGFNDMALSSDFNQLIGVSAVQTTLTTYVVDINLCAPFVEVDQQTGSKYSHERPFTGRVSVNRKSFCVDPGVSENYFPKEHQKLNVKLPNEPQHEQASIEIQDQEAYDKIFNKSYKLAHSPVFDNQKNFISEFEERLKPALNNQPILQIKDTNTEPANNNIPRADYIESVIQESNNKQNQPVKIENKVHPIENKPEISGDSFTDEEIIQKLQMVHRNVAGVLHYRQKYLTQIRNSWTPHNISIAIDAAVKINDNAVIVDLLSVLSQNNHLFTLDTALLLLPQLFQLSSSKYDSYVDSACQILKIILKSFSTLIKQNLSCPPGYVDISREERYRKCSSCYEYLVKIRDTLIKRPVNKPILLLNEVLILLNLLQSE